MSVRWYAGAIAGALVAGGALSAMLIAGEKRTGTPSELAELGRTGVGKLCIATPDATAVPTLGEQSAIQGTHMALAAIAGAAYAATFDEEDAGVLASGTAFGLAFYAAMHWLVGPILGLKEPEWRLGGKTVAAHAVNHMGFGIATALGARLAAR